MWRKPTMCAGQIACVLLLAVGAASAKVDVKTRVACPSEVHPHQIAAIDVTLENGECSPQQVRLLSAVAVNTGQAFGDATVYGPAYMFETIVPAAVNCPFTPSIVQFPLLALPVIPDSLVGTVASYAIVAEWAGGSGGSKTESPHCLVPVNLPEPTALTQLVSGVFGLVVLSRLRRPARS